MATIPNEYDERADKKEVELKLLLTDEFLNTLVESSKVCGWSVDHIETMNFVSWCFDVAGKEKPDLTAYDYNYAL